MKLHCTKCCSWLVFGQCKAPSVRVDLCDLRPIPHDLTALPTEVMFSNKELRLVAKCGAVLTPSVLKPYGVWVNII